MKIKTNRITCAVIFCICSISLFSGCLQQTITQEDLAAYILSNSEKIRQYQFDYDYIINLPDQSIQETRSESYGYLDFHNTTFQIIKTEYITTDTEDIETTTEKIILNGYTYTRTQVLGVTNWDQKSTSPLDYSIATEIQTLLSKCITLLKQDHGFELEENPNSYIVYFDDIADEDTQDIKTLTLKVNKNTFMPTMIHQNRTYDVSILYDTTEPVYAHEYTTLMISGINDHKYLSIPEGNQ